MTPLRQRLAAALLASLAIFARAQIPCGGGLPAYKDVIETFSREPFPERLGKCAIVGSGAQLHGMNRGPTIDSHDTVIRINRIPTGAYYKDLGRRTDIYFSNSISDTYPAGETGLWVTFMEEHNPVGAKSWCQFQDLVVEMSQLRAGLKPTPSNCPFGAAVVARSSKYGSDRITPFKIPDDFDSVFPYGHISEALELFVWTAGAMGNFYMSGGMKAFFMFAPVCDTLTMYGFMGSGNIDGHGTDSVHSFATEHAWMHRISRGDLRPGDFAGRGMRSWMTSNGITGKKVQDDLIDKRDAAVHSLQSHFLCMAGEGKIIIEGWTPGTPGAPALPAPAQPAPAQQAPAQQAPAQKAPAQQAPAQQPPAQQAPAQPQQQWMLPRALPQRGSAPPLLAAAFVASVAVAAGVVFFAVRLSRRRDSPQTTDLTPELDPLDPEGQRQP